MINFAKVMGVLYKCYKSIVYYGLCWEIKSSSTIGHHWFLQTTSNSSIDIENLEICLRSWQLLIILCMGKEFAQRPGFKYLTRLLARTVDPFEITVIRYNNVGDGCWRWNVLVTILGCLWRFWPFWSPTSSISQYSIGIVNFIQNNCKADYWIIQFELMNATIL